MIREPEASDQAFVASTWVKSILMTGRGHRQVPHALRRHGNNRSLGAMVGSSLNAQIDLVMDRSDTRALIMAWDTHPEVILGYLVYAPGPTVHYLWTRREERNGGIATALLCRIGVSDGTQVVCTSQGPSSDDMRSRYKLARYVPLEEFLRDE